MGTAEAMCDEMRRSGSLPALDDNVFEMSNLAQSVRSSASDLASVVLRDCGLTSSLLMTANSTLYSPRFPVKTVSSAVILLGFERVRSLALGLSIFQRSMRSMRDRKLTKLYASSYFSGTMAMSLAREFGYSNPEEIFVAGLLCQLPRLALANTYPERAQEMERLLAGDELTLNQACYQVFQVSYDDICAAVAEVYRVPGKIRDAVLSESARARLANDPVLQLVEQASVLSDMMFGDRPAGAEGIAKVEQRLRKILRRHRFSLDDFIRKACVHDTNITRFFKLDDAAVDEMVARLKRGEKMPAEVIADLDLGQMEEEERLAREHAREATVDQFVEELEECVGQGAELNQVLMLAQETLYRCIDDAGVLVVFLDRHRRLLRGRFYTGNPPHVRAEEFRADAARADHLVVQYLFRPGVHCWMEGEQGELGVSPQFMRRAKLRALAFTHVKVDGNVIGMLVLARPEKRPYSDAEKALIARISRHVAAAFAEAKRRRQQTRESVKPVQFPRLGRGDSRH